MKKSFCRRTTSIAGNKPIIGTNPTKVQMRKPTSQNYIFTQDQFLNEINSGSHVIFDNTYRSMRPKFKYNKDLQKNEICGYEEVTRDSVTIQAAIASNKTSVCGGNPVWIGNEGEKSDARYVNDIKTHCNVTNLRAALLMLFSSAFRTGDGALYFYVSEDNELEWKCFSYENGDNCTETNDYEYPEKDMGVRYFDFNGYDAVEFYRESGVELYIKFPDEDELKNYYPEGFIGKTEDEYYLVKKTEKTTSGNDFCYFREKDIPSGQVQGNIEEFEKTLSDCGENIKYYAYQILFLSGGAISLPNANFGGKVIGSKTSDGDAKILQPADASNTLTIGFEKLWNAICDGSKSVFIRPDNLKGQNDSGAYLTNLYWPEIQWATEFYGRFHPCMKKILRTIKGLVGIIEGNPLGFLKVKLSYEFEPFIPKNKQEQVNIISTAVGSGFMSIETATEEFDSANPLELERIQKESEEKRKLEQDTLTQRSPVPQNFPKNLGGDQDQINAQKQK